MSTPAPRPVPPPSRAAGTPPTLDHRAALWRADLAEIGLAGHVLAASYAEPMRLRCVQPHVPMFAKADSQGAPVSELLWGEPFDAIELSGGWAWGRSVHDGYCGYVHATALAPAGAEPTHRVSERLALVFATPSIKAPVIQRLPFGSRLHATEAEGRFLALESGGYLHDRHTAPVTATEADPVAIAEKFLGAPYGWGGRSEAGIDCSGLVQVALQACGIACPRDSDQQRERVGSALNDAAPLSRGDLVFFPGHVGLMADADQLLHANAYWMRVVTEPVADAVARGNQITAVRRLRAL
ncbi:MAG: C40 family peptidase [Sphingomonadaceae bacterium]|nr:C40 family peptidase [Sphingomonadaceae bacterium]